MPEQRTIKCPFCQTGDIITSYVPKTLVTKTARAASNRKVIKYFKDEKYVVLSETCPSCGKSKKEISEKLSGESSVKVSEAAKRAKEAGLPTRI